MPHCCGLMAGCGKQWKSTVRNLSREEMGGRRRPAAMFLTWLMLINVSQSRTLPLKGLMSHSRDSPHPPPFVRIFTARVGSPRCHVCTNYPDSPQHAPQISAGPQPPLRFAEKTLDTPLSLSSNFKYCFYKIKELKWERVNKEESDFKDTRGLCSKRTPPPPMELMLSSQPLSPSD